MRTVQKGREQPLHCILQVLVCFRVGFDTRRRRSLTILDTVAQSVDVRYIILRYKPYLLCGVVLDIRDVADNRLSWWPVEA